MKFGNHVPTATETDRTGSGRGTQWKFKFTNGYGASVIDHGYGRESGLYELAVLGSDGHLNYDTPVTSDVLGHLTADGVGEALDQIKALSAEAVIQAQIDRETEARDARIAELRKELAALESEAVR